jgi:hypothetical protein
MRAALAQLTAELNAITSGRNRTALVFQANATFSSIGVASIYDSDALFEHHHLPAALASSSEPPTTHTGDSVYRIASISEVYTVLLLLQQEGKVSLDDPVTKCVPGLAAAAANKSVETVDWRAVTLGALASHLAGVGRSCRFRPQQSPLLLYILALPHLSDPFDHSTL